MTKLINSETTATIVILIQMINMMTMNQSIIDTDDKFCLIQKIYSHRMRTVRPA